MIVTRFNSPTLSSVNTDIVYLFFITILISVMTKTISTACFVTITPSNYFQFKNGTNLPDTSNISLTSTTPSNTDYDYISSIGLVFAVVVLPHILISISLILSATGCRKIFFEIILGHPQVCLLPIFTFFVIGSRRLGCTSGHHDDPMQKQLILSKKITALNMIIYFASTSFCSKIFYDFSYLISFITAFVFALPGIILTSTFLCTGTPCCVTDCCNISYHYLI